VYVFASGFVAGGLLYVCQSFVPLALCGALAPSCASPYPNVV
jgi:hypothetical protein